MTFERVSSEDHPSYYVVTIYQRSGSVLCMPYLGGEEAPTDRLRAELWRQAVVTGCRRIRLVAMGTAQRDEP